MAKKIVILGAGSAGVLICKKLVKKFKGIEVDITIIDKNPYHTVLTELHEVAAFRVDESSIRIDIKKIFAGLKVNVVQDNIIKGDYENNIIFGENKEYHYDYLVMATGCKPTFFGVNGAKENSFTLWSYDDAVKIRDHILDIFKRASEEQNLEHKKSLLNFYVVGSGFTGVEMVGELAEFVPIACEKFHIDKSLVRISNVDILERVMPYIPEKLGDKAVKRLNKMGVDVSLKTNVTNIGADFIEIVKDGKTIKDTTHTVIWAAGTEGSDIALSSEALGLVKGTRGRIELDKHLRSLTHKNVYVAGDNMFYIPEGEDKPVPQMVENCEAAAPIIAQNIYDEVNEQQPSQVYAPRFHGIMVCIGGRYGVAHIGGNKKVALPSFFAMFAKHFINMIYFFHLAGWSKVYAYLKHEFFTIRNKRSFVGGHFSNRTPVFFLVPLRIFMGIYFIYYAYQRFAMGWFTTSRLRDVFYNVAGQFRPTVFDFSMGQWFNFSVYVFGGQMNMWLRSTPMNWFFQTFVFASEGSEIFFQSLVVIFELLVGLALIVGLLTSLVSFAVLAAVLLIVLTVGLPFYTWWLPFAAVAMIFTGGKVLSFDYYVIPWLNKRWKSLNFVKKLHIYND